MNWDYRIFTVVPRKRKINGRLARREKLCHTIRVYCLIPSNKGQRMMVIKGSGGEGKSQIGAVLSALFGSNMKDGSIGKISENRFARADLEHILLCIDDDTLSFSFSKICPQENAVFFCSK